MKSNLIFIGVIVACAAAFHGLCQALPVYPAQLLQLAAINALLALSLNLVTGLSGQFSLGTAGFMAVGAYLSASVTSPEVNLLGLAWLNSSPAGGQALFLAGLGLAALGAGLAGYLVGLPCLRLRGDYLAIVTLAFGEIIRSVILNIPAVGEARGLSGIPKLATPFLAGLCVALAAGVLLRLLKTSQGRALLATRDDEIAASSLGVNTTRFKVSAFAASSAAAGVAGAFYAHAITYINPNSFTFLKSVEVVIMVVLGGLGSLSGSIVAALLLTLLPEALRPAREALASAFNNPGLDLRLTIYSLLLVVMMLLRPQGLFGKKEIWDLWPFRRGGFKTRPYNDQES